MAQAPLHTKNSLFRCTADRLHGDAGLEVGPVGAGFAPGWEPVLRDHTPPQGF